VRTDFALELLNRLLWTCVMVSAPVLIACLVVGLLISVLQVATQIQEMTLSYVPKLAVAAFVLIAAGPWMIHRITQFAVETIKLIPTLN
jgi:flagellar biosynthetic protein FliQ